MFPYLNKVTAKGRIYYRYRRNGQIIPLPSDPAMPEFMAAYHRIHASFETGTSLADMALPGSIAALITAYKKSAEYMELKPRVKDLYVGALDQIKIKLGKYPAKKLTRRVALEWRDTLIDTPAKANNLMSVLKRLYSFGVDRGHVKVHPVAGIARLKVGEWRPWTVGEVTAFREKAEPHMRLALDLALYTGQRLGDVAAMRWNHIEDGGINVKQQKGDERLWIPIHRNLWTAIEAAKAEKKRRNAEREKRKISKLPDAITILAAARGNPYTAENLKHKFKDALRATGLPNDLVFHGLRKTAAVMLAEAGCTTEQIKAITGHRTDEMVAYYARQANQKVLAKAAVRKLERKK